MCFCTNTDVNHCRVCEPKPCSLFPPSMLFPIADICIAKLEKSFLPIPQRELAKLLMLQIKNNQELATEAYNDMIELSDTDDSLNRFVNALCIKEIKEEELQQLCRLLHLDVNKI